jgi:hypothetical protein
LLGGTGGEGESLVGFEGHGLEHEAHTPDSGMAKCLRPLRCRRTL